MKCKTTPEVYAGVQGKVYARKKMHIWAATHCSLDTLYNNDSFHNYHMNLLC